MYFRNCRLQRKSLDKCLKCRIAEHHWTVNMLKGPEHCWLMYFPNYGLQKTWLDKCLNTTAEYCWPVNMLNSRKPWWNVHGNTFMKFFHHWENSNWNMSVSFYYEVLVLFVKILTPDDKYSLLNSENLLQPIQIQLTFYLFIYLFFYLVVFPGLVTLSILHT